MTRPVARAVAPLAVALGVVGLAGCGEASSGAGSAPGTTSASAPARGASTTTPSGTPTPSGPSGPARLTIVVDDGSGTRTTWSLTCDPAGGTHPDPAKACGVLGANGSAALAPVPKGRACTQIFGGPQRATVRGTWRGAAVNSALDRTDGCQTERWAQLLGLLPPGGAT